MRPRAAAGIGVAIAIVIGGLSLAKWREARAPAAAKVSIVAVRITRRDALGLPSKKSVLREPARVRALIDALGIDTHPVGTCPPDYADAPIGIVLSGLDVYARRNVYVFGGSGAEAGSGAGAPSVVTVTSAGCKVGPAADAAAMEREIAAAKPMNE
ncbi:MAG: hypothetical protein JST00_25220 [Deltaproteobacteria bacterium]|nr:hypothetical protein [Deltaproteobacteria bacterium]